MEHTQRQTDKAFGLQGDLRRVVAVILIIVYGGCCSFLYFSFISFPSTEAIARNYLYGVINGDLGRAMSWTNPACRDEARHNALNDIDKYGFSEVRKVAVDVEDNLTGSDEEIQFASVKFEYRKRSETEWQQGEMVIITDHNVPGLRYTCGNLRSEPWVANATQSLCKNGNANLNGGQRG
jgi:hypothetical protein